MNRLLILIALILANSLTTMRAADSGEDTQPAPAPAPVAYDVKVHQFEGCECASVCPCVFSRDTTYGDCRGIMSLTFNGTYGDTKLNNVSCVGVVTRSGKNMEATMGTWTGALYVSDKATPAEREAVKALVHVMMGDAFGEMQEHVAPITIKSGADDSHELTVGKIAHLRLHPIRAANGKNAQIVNAPSPLAFPVMTCAIADENTYDDGKTSWSFTGRNAFFSDFDLTSGN